MEHFFTKLITGSFLSILAIVLGTLLIQLYEFLVGFSILLKLDGQVHHNFLTVCSDMIFRIISVVGLKCFFNGFAVKVELTDLKVDLGDRHFTQILVKLDFLLVKDRIGILLPDLFYEIKGRIHFVIIGLDFL